MTINRRRFIAERKLLVAKKGSADRKPVAIRISEPFTVKQEDVTFPVDGIIAGCHIAIEGLDVPGHDVYGMDSVQAVSLASNIEPLVESMSVDFDFFWASGDPYFDR